LPDNIQPSDFCQPQKSKPAFPDQNFLNP